MMREYVVDPFEVMFVREIFDADAYSVALPTDGHSAG
jgi:hypothetical protein